MSEVDLPRLVCWVPHMYVKLRKIYKGFSVLNGEKYRHLDCIYFVHCIRTHNTNNIEFESPNVVKMFYKNKL